MIELTSKQKSLLRGLGQKTPVSVHVGKEGLSEGLLEQVRRVLSVHELVKIRLTAGPAAERRDQGETIAQSVGAACAGVLGRTALLYRPNENIAKNKRINVEK